MPEKMYGTHDVTLLSTAYAKAIRAAESDKYEKAARYQFKAIARLIWESCGSNVGVMSQKTRELLDLPEGSE